MELNFESEQAIRKTFIFFVAFDLMLVIGDIFFNWNALFGSGEIRLLFNLTREDALATTYSSFQAIFAGLIGLLIALVLNAKKELNRSRGWTVMGLFFVYIGIDDAAQIHERCGTAFKTFLSESSLFQGNLAQYSSYGWHLIFGGFFGSMAVFILIFLWKEFPTRRRQLMYLSALGCLVLAVGMDFIEGLAGGHEGIAASLEVKASFIRHFSKVTEEFIEMFGTTLFLISFLIHFIQEAPEFTIRFTKNKSANRLMKKPAN